MVHCVIIEMRRKKTNMLIVIWNEPLNSLSVNTQIPTSFRQTYQYGGARRPQTPVGLTAGYSACSWRGQWALIGRLAADSGVYLLV